MKPWSSVFPPVTMTLPYRPWEQGGARLQGPAPASLPAAPPQSPCSPPASRRAPLPRHSLRPHRADVDVTHADAGGHHVAHTQHGVPRQALPRKVTWGLGPSTLSPQTPGSFPAPPHPPQNAGLWGIQPAPNQYLPRGGGGANLDIGGIKQALWNAEPLGTVVCVVAVGHLVVHCGHLCSHPAQETERLCLGVLTEDQGHPQSPRPALLPTPGRGCHLLLVIGRVRDLQHRGLEVLNHLLRTQGAGQGPGSLRSIPEPPTCQASLSLPLYSWQGTSCWGGPGAVSGDSLLTLHM